MSHGKSAAGAPAPARTKPKRTERWRRCNLCAEEFRPQAPFERYCAVCRQESELLRFSEWLPGLNAAIIERLSA